MVAIRLDAPITSFTISLTIYFAYGLKTMFKLLIRAYFISALTFGFKKIESNSLQNLITFHWLLTLTPC